MHHPDEVRWGALDRVGCTIRTPAFWAKLMRCSASAMWTVVPCAYGVCKMFCGVCWSPRMFMGHASASCLTSGVEAQER